MQVGHDSVKAEPRCLELAQWLSSTLVHGEEKRCFAVIPDRGVEEHVGCDHHRGVVQISGRGNLESLKCRVILNESRGPPVRDPPEVLTGVEVDGGDPAVGGLHER